MKVSAMRLTLLMVVTALCSCIGLSHLRELEIFHRYYSEGKFVEASKLLNGDSGLNYDSDQLLISLHAAAALRASGKIAESQIVFDQAEKLLLWKSNDITSASDLFEEGLTLATNNLAVVYQGTIYDGVMLNTYKALNAMSIGDVDRARVELNRASQRQHNAANQLAIKVRVIERNDINSPQPGNQFMEENGEKIDWTTYSESAIVNLMAYTGRMEAYHHLFNPFTTWLHAVFRLSTKEPSRAADLLRKIVVYDDERNSQVTDDLLFAEQIADGYQSESRVWVVHEDGVGPHLEQYRFQYRIPTEHGPVTASVAVPSLFPGIPAYGELEIHSDGHISSTELLLDVNRYVATEFKAGYKGLLTKAIISAGIKTLLQMEIQKNADKQALFGSLLSVVVPAVAAEITQADIRMWRTLPHSVGVASFSRPASGKLRIMADSVEIAEIILPKGQFVLVNIITTQMGAPFGLSTMTLMGE